MKRALCVLVLAGSVAAVTAPSAQTQTQTTSTAPARWYDVQRLQDDLAVLDDTLARVPASHSRSREFQDRAVALHSELSRLRDDIDRRPDGDQLPVSAGDIERLRNRIRDLQGDVDTALDRRWSGTGSVVLPEGTEITVRLERPLSSRTARVEDRAAAVVARPLYVDGRVIVAAGARVLGVVTEARPAQRPGHGGRVVVSFDRLLLDDGSGVDLRSRVIRVSDDMGSHEVAKHAGIGAALGGVLGGVVAGKKGALVGVLLGGAGGAISSEGDDVELPEGTVFTLQLDRAATVGRP